MLSIGCFWKLVEFLFPSWPIHLAFWYAVSSHAPKLVNNNSVQDSHLKVNIIMLSFLYQRPCWDWPSQSLTLGDTVSKHMPMIFNNILKKSIGVRENPLNIKRILDIVGPYHLWVVVTNEHIKLGKENPSSVLLKKSLNHVGFLIKSGAKWSTTSSGPSRIVSRPF